MTLREIIEYADNMRPNAFAPQDKVRWLNELELSVQVDVMGREEDPVVHSWSENWSGTGLRFPDSGTVIIPAELHLNAGGRLSLEGMTDYAGNEIRVAPVLAAARSGGTTTVTLAAGTFRDTGADPETGTAVLTDAGQEEEMAAPVLWHKIYYTYLESRIDAQNSEWGMYANSITLYNQFAGEFMRWYARKYIDPED